MLPEPLARKYSKRVFAGMMLTSIWAISGATSSQNAGAVGPRQVQLGDAISPGFFSPPPGVRPANRIMPSRIPHARPSYAWRIHGKKRELVAFSTPIQHVVVIYLENRTPEDLFGSFWNVVNPNTGHPFGVDLDLVNPTQSPLALAPVLLTDSGNPNHEHSKGFIDDVAGRWDVHGYTYVATPAPGASSSVTNYIQLIETWAYENHTLQSNEGPSFEAHQYAIAGQSGGLSDSNIAPQGMADNPSPGISPPGDGTCVTAASQTTLSVNMYSPWPTPLVSYVSPCPDYTTIFDLLVDSQPTPVPSPYYLWQYVAMDTTSIWSAPLAVQHLYGDYSADPNPIKTGQPFAVDPDAENFALNVSNSTSPTPNPARPFAELTFLTPCVGESDHPNGLGNGNGGGFDDAPDWLAYVLNNIGNSTYWDNTAVIVTWDDWGGFYDNYTPAAPGTTWPYHMTPNPYSAPPNTGNTSDPNEWGYRVPLIVISPYAKTKYISTTLISQGAILNFIENVFSLGTNALNGDDLTNGTNDLTDMFDFSQSPISWPSGLNSHFTPLNNDACPTATPSP
jgi:phospholipase C